METVALSPALGVEIKAVGDLFDDAVVRQCMEALKWRGVLLIRDANLDDQGQLALSRKLGDVVALGGREVFPISLDPSVNRAAEYLRASLYWHLDGTTDDVPIKATMLTARHVRMANAGTDFANTYAAYESLPEEKRKLYDDLRVVHTFEVSQRLFTPDPTDEQLTRWRAVPAHENPLVWKRRDGRRSLVIGATADHIVGMAPAESRALLDELLEWTTQDRFRYTHEWQVGDLLIWDNTGVLHRALPYDATSERLLHRTTIVGDEALT